ncbi:DUF305 domain-containing protein [Streptomyces sp. TRM 70351]|uniref:DUF305 domain-containing protein n=1 Tax=Streptomyces sp. TRM 70351 TaxID=3116552 RepID=UPI002E7B1B91|nr:DUF305 domain-containing protein [Streptomyces sp. TRM 70351]MEE1927242.1 DUF305 domain-containing protein [Streptomyces sp. TRM 70351]
MVTIRRTPRRVPARALPLTLAALTALLAGCTGPAKDEPAGGGPAVIAPGSPGEAARTVSPEEAQEAGRRQTRPNTADVTFMTMMIEHHQQALVMADLATERSGSKPVRALAERIRVSQGPEIAAMRAWLDRNDAAGPAAGGHEHDHGGMPGTASPEELAQLRAARGADFDSRFLALMTAHHEGAVEMVTDVLADGNDVTVEELATEMAAQQTAEIVRMRRMG